MVVVVYVCNSSTGEGEEDLSVMTKPILKKEENKEKQTKMKGWWLMS